MDGPRRGALHPARAQAEQLRREAVELLSASPGVQAVAAFGSWGRGEADGWSDLDLLVAVPGGPDAAWQVFETLKQAKPVLHHNPFTSDEVERHCHVLGIVFETESVFHNLDLNFVEQPPFPDRFGPVDLLFQAPVSDALLARRALSPAPSGGPLPEEARLGLAQHWLKKALKRYLRGQGDLSRVRETAAELQQVLHDTPPDLRLPTGDLRRVAQTYLDLGQQILAAQPTV